MLIDVEGSDPDNLDLIHQCEHCGKISRNRMASDDNKELAIQKSLEKSTDWKRGPKRS